METLSTLRAICAGNSLVPCEFPAQRPVTWCFDVFFDLHPNKWLNKQWWGWWFEMPLRQLWCHCNGIASKIWHKFHSTVLKLNSWYDLVLVLSYVTLIKWNKTRQIWGIWKLRLPKVRKRPIWVKIGDVLYRVTLKFDGWPWKTIGHLSFAVSSFVQHFIAIGEFKLELQSGNAQFGSNWTIFRAVWPCNLTYDLEKQ